MTDRPGGKTVRDCDLCILGAGYAALNGLSAAAKYLKKGERVVVIDKGPTWGGHWNEQYDFVRLHQPYQAFTAGDLKWRLPGRARSYLATRREIVDHLRSVPSQCASHLEIEPLFRHEYREHRVRAGQVEIEAVPLAGDGIPVRVRAKRLLKGTGLNHGILPPFRVSSARVRSVGVADPVLQTREFIDSDSPVYVIGSGKTAMDCVLWLASHGRRPRRKVTIIIGSGMWFMTRDEMFPTGFGRYTKGGPTTDFLRRVADRFDGQNEADVVQYLERKNLLMNVFGTAANFRFGILSRAEREGVLARVDEIIRGHLVDVDGKRMIVREGGTERAFDIADGAWLINCTAHIRELPHEPLLQDDGLVCSTQAPLSLPGPSAYFVTHLWFRDALAPLGDKIFRIREVEPKLRLMGHAALAMVANMALMMDRLPLSVSAAYEGSHDRWYPRHRQLLSVMRLRVARDEQLAKAHRLLPLRFSDPVAPESRNRATLVSRRTGSREVDGPA